MGRNACKPKTSLEFAKNVPLPNNGAYLQGAWPLATAQLANLSEGLSVEAAVLLSMMMAMEWQVIPRPELLLE